MGLGGTTKGGHGGPFGSLVPHIFPNKDLCP